MATLKPSSPPKATNAMST